MTDAPRITLTYHNMGPDYETGADEYVRVDALPLSDALAIPEVAALVKAAKAIGIAASGVQRRGKTQDDWNRLRAARVMLDAALRKIEEGRG